MTTQFSGESAWDAVINHNSLDIVQEGAFLRFCEARGVTWDLASLTAAYAIWSEGDSLAVTVRACLDCGCPVEGGPTRCIPCANKGRGA